MDATQHHSVSVAHEQQTPPHTEMFFLHGRVNEDMSEAFHEFTEKVIADHQQRLQEDPPKVKKQNDLLSFRAFAADSNHQSFENPADVVLYINSGGGLIDHGIKIIQDIEKLKACGIRVWTVPLRASSIAATIQSAGTKGCRTTHKEAQLGLHARSNSRDGLIHIYKELHNIDPEYPKKAATAYPFAYPKDFLLDYDDAISSLKHGPERVILQEDLRSPHFRYLQSKTGLDPDVLQICFSDIRMAYAQGEELIDCGFADIMFDKAPPHIRATAERAMAISEELIQMETGASLGDTSYER